MPYLGATRKGWENEHLALFILSRFAFCANPVTVSDDLGTDFFCCLFERRKKGGIDAVLPVNSFAVQVKSNTASFDATGKISYLDDLEVPFLVGVVSRARLTLSIYSGEYLPYFFSFKGKPKRLRIKLVDHAVSPNRCIESFGPNKFRVLFPLVVRITANASRAELGTVVRDLRYLCRAIHGNIATRRTDEHVYDFGETKGIRILAGPGSVKVFRNNLYKRLAEAFFNFWWMMDQERRFDLEEAKLYLDFYRKLKEHVRLPKFLTRRYRELVDRIDADY